MGYLSSFSLLSFSQFLCCVFSFCFELPNPDIHVQIYLNYTTCHMQGRIQAGPSALGACSTFKHDQFTGQFEPLNLNYSTAAPVGALVLGLQLFGHRHQCTFNGSYYCCKQPFNSPSPLQHHLPVLPHLILLGAVAVTHGMLSACLVQGRRFTTKLD
ncbi:ORF5 protein [Simian hemorrhagic encephalitis virus]|uniref:ORF5 protein n=1 Tax=Simian hemorrhagic encephalitis virus TaxID=1965068 RepID=A0A0F6PTV2_9NIDO|nr:ORF5 protein [Simian hemorrhagic encephalitis virus]AKC89298.1 ORF5 protein [Simian hemorrhagic encephalitis virus]